MTSLTRPRRTTMILLVAALVAVLAAALAGVLRPWATVDAEQAAGEDPALLPTPISLPEHPDVLVFGDSWTYGSAATRIDLGYAYRLAGLLDGRTVVDGGRGSGYLHPGMDRPPYGARFEALDPDAHYDLIVVQGSINDRHEDLAGYDAAVNAAWDRLTQIYPDTPVVILGPAPQVLPVETKTAQIDRRLASLAAARQWWYVSPIQDDWITPANYAALIDTSEIGKDHPSDAGHEYLAHRLAEALTAITDPSTSVEASDDAPAG